MQQLECKILRLPLPEPPVNALPIVRHEVRGHTIILSQPDRAYEPAVAVNQYQSHMLPNARLAGL